MNQILQVGDSTKKFMYDYKHIMTKSGEMAVTINDSLKQEEAKEMLEPIIEVGKEIQEIVRTEVSLAELSEIGITEADYQAFLALEEVEVAQLAFALSALYPYDEFTVDDFPNYEVSLSVVMDCLVVALGLDNFNGIQDILTSGGDIGLIINGTKKLINSKTVLQLFKALGMRTIGYIGLAYSIYQFADCMNTHR